MLGGFFDRKGGIVVYVVDEILRNEWIVVDDCVDDGVGWLCGIGVVGVG